MMLDHNFHRCRPDRGLAVRSNLADSEVVLSVGEAGDVRREIRTGVIDICVGEIGMCRSLQLEPGIFLIGIRSPRLPRELNTAGLRVVGGVVSHDRGAERVGYLAGPFLSDSRRMTD